LRFRPFVTTNAFMKKFTFLFLFFGATLRAQKPITLEDCFVYFKFYPQSVAGNQYLRDGARYVSAAETGLKVFDVRRPQWDSIIRVTTSEAAKGYDQFEFSEDESKLLLRNATEPVYRHSVLAHYFVYDLNTKNTTPVFEKTKQQFAALSPDGLKIAFVADNNLFYKDLSNNKLIQITDDGEKNKVINGLPDWVYEEEFSPVDGHGMVATQWSLDGTKIAFLRFDESVVPQMQLTWYEGGVYPRYSYFKYPKVGEANSGVTAHIYDLESGKTTRVQHLENGENPDCYLPRLHWTSENRLVVSKLNRKQNQLDLLLVDPGTGKTSLLLRETDSAYVEIESEKKLIFLKNGRRFIWTSEKSGYNHIYLYSPAPDWSLGEPIPLTTGAFDVTAFYGVDEKNGTFYYQTATPTPMDRQIWEGRMDGGAPRLLTPGAGTHEADFSPTFDYYTLTASDANTPPVYTLCKRNGEALRTLADNKRVVKMRSDYGFASKEFFAFKRSDGTDLNGWMLKPPKMEPGRKYPVLFDVYGGPGSQTVQNQYDPYYDSWRQMLVQQGVIVVSVDNRGTGGRGRDFKKCTQLQLGKYETEDQIAAARYLGTLPYIDANRIGIWGWSFGGYLSTSCILKGADVFKMAIAVAPVTNWKWYDSVYTERYMHGTADNAKGYEENSPINYAKNLRGDNYLICHGMADDNVHWQQSVEMINALIAADKQFETYYYPNRNHGIYGDNATIHLFTKLTAFIREKL
jgi:dipeptidyl-peptidase 4